MERKTASHQGTTRASETSYRHSCSARSLRDRWGMAWMHTSR